MVSVKSCENTLHFINCSVLQGLPALRKAVILHDLCKIMIIYHYDDINDVMFDVMFDTFTVCTCMIFLVSLWQCSVIFGNFRKMFRNVCGAFRQL